MTIEQAKQNIGELIVLNEDYGGAKKGKLARIEHVYYGAGLVDAECLTPFKTRAGKTRKHFTVFAKRISLFE